MPPGCQDADALGDPAVAAAEGPADAPVDTDATDAAERAAPPNSRRLPAAATHANGAAAGPSPEPPEANHVNKSLPTPETPPEAARRAAVTAGAGAAGGEAVIAGAASAVSAICEGAAESDAALSADLPTVGRDIDGVTLRGVTESLEVSPGWVGAWCEPRRLGAGTEARSTGLRSPPPVVVSGAPEAAAAARRGVPGADGDPASATATRPRRGFCGAPLEAESDLMEPLASDDPSGLAVARGIEMSALPTPRATASAPTRPTNAAPLVRGD